MTCSACSPEGNHLLHSSADGTTRGCTAIMECAARTRMQPSKGVCRSTLVVSEYFLSSSAVHCNRTKSPSNHHCLNSFLSAATPSGSLFGMLPIQYQLLCFPSKHEDAHARRFAEDENAFNMFLKDGRSLIGKNAACSSVVEAEMWFLLLVLQQEWHVARAEMYQEYTWKFCRQCGW